MFLNVGIMYFGLGSILQMVTTGQRHSWMGKPNPGRQDGDKVYVKVLLAAGMCTHKNDQTTRVLVKSF